MELLTATYCPYCKSRLDAESILENENLNDVCIYPECPECKKTFVAFVKTEVKMNAISIENEIEKEKESLLFWKEARMTAKTFKNSRIEECKERIQELEAIKERNDKE